MIGEQLAMLAKVKNINQVQLAEQCGMSRIAINRFFRGRSQLNADKTASIMTALGVPIEKYIEMEIEATLRRKQATPAMSHATN